MSFSLRVLFAVVAATVTLALPANAADAIRLASEAQADGFVYEWLPNGSGVTLTRPGVRVVITIGQRSYDVNDATPIADVAPSFDGRDIIISPRLASHLHAIAVAAATRNTNDVAIAPPPRPVPYHGTMTLTCRQIPGSNILEITGTGPVDTSVTVVLHAAISRDLPYVTLARSVVRSQKDGSYVTRLSFDQAAHRTAILMLDASAGSDASATARFTVDVPSAAIPGSALDAWPK